MKFRFPLQSALSYRQRLKEEAQIQYYQAKKRVDDALDRINELYLLTDRTRFEIQKIQSMESGQVASIQMRVDFLNGIKSKIEAERTSVRTLMMEAESKHEALLETVKQFKSLEKLKSRRYFDFVRKIRREEIKDIDEMVTMRHKTEASE